LLGLVMPYGWFVAGIIALTVASNGLSLVVPKLTGAAIDAYGKGGFDPKTLSIQFLLVAFLFSYSLICREWCRLSRPKLSRAICEPG